jgi:hypothetical protein
MSLFVLVSHSLEVSQPRFSTLAIQWRALDAFNRTQKASKDDLINCSPRNCDISSRPMLFRATDSRLWDYKRILWLFRFPFPFEAIYETSFSVLRFPLPQCLDETVLSWRIEFFLISSTHFECNWRFDRSILCLDFTEHSSAFGVASFFHHHCYCFRVAFTHKPERLIIRLHRNFQQILLSHFPRSFSPVTWICVGVYMKLASFLLTTQKFSDLMSPEKH